MSDLMVSNTGQFAQNYDVDSEKGIEAFNYLKTFFPNESIEDYASVTDSYIHEVFNTECVRTCVPNRVSLDMLGKFTTSAHRVFVLNTGESYFLANQLFTDEQPTWKPDRSFVLAVMEPYAEYKNTTPEGFDSFKEYIVAMRPEVAVSELGVSSENATVSAAYGMLVNTSGTVVAIRSYIGYGTGRGTAETLQSRHLFLCRRNKRIDLARSFRDGNYIDT
tara:strand:+ start:1956 stop:2615 length:660 start_codon:yes stop_codon:yes gene_type:complete